MVSFLSDESAAIHRPDEVIGWEYNDMKAMRVVTIRLIGEPFGAKAWQIFDLTVDPGESHDLPAEMPELKQRLIETREVYANSIGGVPL